MPKKINRKLWLFYLQILNLFRFQHITHMYFRFRNRIPDWAINDMDKMKYIREVNYKIKSIPQLVRLKTGFLIKDIFDRFAQKINGTLNPTNRTLWVYSGHSTTIKLLFNGLGLSSVCATQNIGQNRGKNLNKWFCCFYSVFAFLALLPGIWLQFALGIVQDARE